MARAEARFTVDRPKDAVLAFLRDPAQVGECLAFVAGTERGPEGDRWKVKAPMSVITQTPHLDVAFQVEGNQVRWQGRGRHLDIRGTFTVGEGPARATEVACTLEVLPLGALAPVLEPLAEAQVGGQLDYFVREVRTRLAL
ncbi:MAG: SRPBCC family protein [Anaerolineae bacterium]